MKSRLSTENLEDEVWVETHMTRIEDRNGNKIDFTYNGGQLVSMGQAGGRAIGIESDAAP